MRKSIGTYQQDEFRGARLRIYGLTLISQMKGEYLSGPKRVVWAYRSLSGNVAFTAIADFPCPLTSTTKHGSFSKVRNYQFCILAKNSICPGMKSNGGPLFGPSYSSKLLFCINFSFGKSFRNVSTEGMKGLKMRLSLVQYSKITQTIESWRTLLPRPLVPRSHCKQLPLSSILITSGFVRFLTALFQPAWVLHSCFSSNVKTSSISFECPGNL